MKSVVSVVIPCKNEEKNIGRCISAILKQDDVDLLEIIVVDNGSEDGTLAILESFRGRITVLSLHEASIGQVRNYGFRNASASWLAFIDGDVEVAYDWLKTLVAALDREAKTGIDVTKLVTGSTCTIPEDASWIERVWFGHLAARDSKGKGYINSGHLIVHRSLFEVVGGFPASLKTGEDEAFCEEARRRGGIVRKFPEIRAIHHGYPKTLSDLFVRERWHGLGMERHLHEPWNYRDLMLALYNGTLIFLLAVSVVAGLALRWSLIVVAVFLVLPLAVFSVLRLGGKVYEAAKLTVIFLVYGGAKTVALGDIFVRRFSRMLRGG